MLCAVSKAKAIFSVMMSVGLHLPVLILLTMLGDKSASSDRHT